MFAPAAVCVFDTCSRYRPSRPGRVVNRSRTCSSCQRVWVHSMIRRTAVRGEVSQSDERCFRWHRHWRQTVWLGPVCLAGLPGCLPVALSTRFYVCTTDVLLAIMITDARRCFVGSPLGITESEVLIWLRSVVRRPLNSCSGVALKFPFDEDALRFSAAVVMACACFSSKCLLIRSCVTTSI